MKRTKLYTLENITFVLSSTIDIHGIRQLYIKWPKNTLYNLSMVENNQTLDSNDSYGIQSFIHDEHI